MSRVSRVVGRDEACELAVEFLRSRDVRVREADVDELVDRVLELTRARRLGVSVEELAVFDRMEGV